jgi:outer membrane receptor protein involved in Fe transport
MLNTLPQFTPWITEYTNNRTGPNPTGQAIMDLRGLGFGRTLVLLDGKRIMPSNGYGSVDVNLIPEAIIQRVEIVSGGASAVYGSDAVAGVVNFITRRFSGLEAEASWTQTDVGDGETWSAGINGGLKFSRGYAYGHISVAERDPVMQGDRKFSEVAIGYDDEQQDFIPLGSPAIRQGRTFPEFWNLPSQSAIDDYFMAVDPAYAQGALDPWASFGFNPDGSLFSIYPVYNFTGDWNEPLQPVETSEYTYNFAPVNFLRVPMQRTNFFGRAGLDVGDSTELFIQAHWAGYDAGAQLAPAPVWDLWIAPDNPHIDPALSAILASRPDPDLPIYFVKRMSDVGPRIRTADYEAWQVVLGASGTSPVLTDWKYDIYGAYGQVDQSRTIQNGVSRTAFEELSLAPDAGASICGGSGMNPFGIDSISPECAAHIRRVGTERTEIRQTVGEATITGPILDLPAGMARMALGLFYKEDRFENVGDEALTVERVDPVYGYPINDVDFGGPAGTENILGETRSREAFVEVNIPLLADARFADSLEATLGFRYGDHSNAGTIEAWKAETVWQINDPLTLRASFQQAVRAPDFYALFAPQLTETFWWFNGEPCESNYDPAGNGVPGAQVDPEVAALCVAQGIPEDILPTFTDPKRFALGTIGGNTDLTEETAETFTAGLVLRPSWKFLAGLQASLDYYRIEVEDIVGYLGFPIFNCFDRQLNPALDPQNIYCQKFRRNPVTYQIEDIRDIAINLSEMSVSGYDLQMDIAFDAGPGLLNLHGAANYAESATQTAAPGSPEQEFVGKATQFSIIAQSAFFSLVPRIKATASAGYVVDSFDVNLMWRYIDNIKDDQIENFRIPSRQYFDLTFGFVPDNGFLEGIAFRAGVTNLTNTDPPVYPSWVEANTEPSIYDVLGRRYFVRLAYRF